jgi:hypothetical protein
MKKVLTLFLLLLSLNSFAKTYYVNSKATGDSTGSSWPNAFVNLHNALAVAISGDSIKVAAGIYSPASFEEHISFRLGRGVVLLGGYPNSGSPTDLQRSWVDNPTTLSGALSNGYYTSTLILAQNIDTTTTIDGFLIKNARSDVQGGGIHIVNSVGIVIKNSVFENNYNNVISVLNSSVLFNNCVVNKNNINGWNRVIYNSTNSNTSFYNCVVSGNTSSTDEYSVIVNKDASINFINCSIVNNTGTAFYGNGSGLAVFKNSILWNNLSYYNRYEENDIIPTNQNITVSHTITQTYHAGDALLVAANPRFLNIKNPAGADNKFFTSDDGLQLTAPCSPALNYGDGSSVSLTTIDILGNPRKYNNETVDLGAYERQGAIGTALKTVYVSNAPGNTGNNDGSSWQNAFKTLQQALLYCADTIKMAEGVYLTDNSYRDSVFIIENKKVILGGYPSTGNPADADRDPNRYVTVLKGNYQATSTGTTSPVLKSYYNDSTTIIDGLAFNNKANTESFSNAALSISYGSKLRVLNCNFTVADSSDLQSTGIDISKSSAPLIFRSKFNTYQSEKGGIAILCSGNSSPQIAYCTFIGNSYVQPVWQGLRGGTAISFADCSVSLDSCIFLKKSSSASGPMVTSSNSDFTIRNCEFRSFSYPGSLLSCYNSTGLVENSFFQNSRSGFSDPAVIYNDNSNPVFNKCLFDSSYLFIQNVNYSAPVFNNCVSVNGSFMKNKRSFPVLNNCTIVNTSTYTSESALINNEDSSVLRAHNTIFWADKLAPGEKDINDKVAYNNFYPNSVSILTNCLTQNYGVNGVSSNKVGLNPRFDQLRDIKGPDNKMFTADDGLRLAKCSPAANGGNSALGTVLSTDVLGNTRIVNTIVDMGAYELQEASGAPNAYYVSASAKGDNSGVDWQNAYTDLQTAVCNVCADTIRVAAGTYKPAVTDRDSTFFINRPVSLWGGYPSMGSPGDDVRDPFSNPTILSGNIGNPNDSLDNTRTVMAVIGIKDSAVIDGFIITGGYQSSGISLNGQGGAGVYTYYSRTSIRNCQFINNRANPYGGGIGIGSRASSSVSHCIFLGNSSQNAGGGLAMLGDSVEISGCVFENNFSFGMGGAVSLNPTRNSIWGGAGNGLKIRNSIFYKNYTTANNANGLGGAVHAEHGAGKIFNCTFLENRTTYAYSLSGGGLYTNNNFNMPIRNCIFKGNMVGGSSTALGADIDWNGNYSYILNCLLQTNRSYTLGPNLFNIDPNFIDTINPKGADGRWFTSDDGLQLNFSSPAIDYGDNVIATGVSSDILGNTRIVNNTIDVGPYEYLDKPVAKAGNDTTICVGTSVQIGTLGNAKHTYSWTSSPTGFTSTLSNPIVAPTVTTTYFLMVSNAGYVAKDTIIVTPVNSITPAVTIATTNAAICHGTSATFTAIPAYEGGTPAYQWQVNGENTGMNSATFTTLALTNGSKVQVVLTSSASCAVTSTATSNSIVMIVKPVVSPSVSISTPATSICPGTNSVFTATVSNAGTTPLYRWVRNELVVGTNATYSNNSIADGDRVWVIMTSNAECASPTTDTSNVITMIVNSTATPFVSIIASATNICAGTNVTFTATSLDGGAAPIYQWKRNGTVEGGNGSTYSSATLANGDVISVTMTSSAACASNSIVNSNPIAMVVNPKMMPFVQISGVTSVSQGDSAIITATTVNGGSYPLYQWQDSTSTNSWQNIIGATNSGLLYMPKATGNKVRCILTSTSNCVLSTTAVSNVLNFSVITAASQSAANLGIRHYPNPANKTLIIDSLKVTDQWEMVEISGIDGRQKIITQSLKDQTRVVINLEKLQSGFYIAILRRKTGAAVYVKFTKL